ncbi:putative alpha-isopropylmalate/homocitrate synthase family transferase [Rhodospirillum rubrum F11]|uniref:Citramalate synthase n=2 Tax=Rhodospirillum rubrum TaxID=1085 RepID=Q2RWJ6_RHORT|nr:citramalate synthase [Rhodospirillum rubrum]ABC21499.1 2-isopropylmalate synthase [Rhodospirillum rubrum ATCC 11170]AEO47182.1 putative alpha-isopropylmalate/homocitrate synthase family transferase [Rhodospirillum rubrum F11]MBK5953095.1 citramalate synthase [Rhodospirillum rubrum]QXG81173.1 citramalate synthase [Rhodospirillum rubrum]HCF17025.1 citramalate synthase [Rhodospirillum rubrum]
MSDKRVYLYDSTLRDGAQTQGVDFSATDKAAIARELDALGIDYVEGGWPGANPTDDALFANPPVLRRARLSAFGMTRRSGRSAENDPSLQALFCPGVRVVTMVGKTWDFQCEVAIGVPLDENRKMIADSIAHAAARVEEAVFDAEHFFDGYKSNPDYALSCVRAAYEAGARWVVLCDTNGGTLPHQIEAIVGAVAAVIPGDHLGIHCHNDTENAVANSLAAVRAGARQVQGTLNGLGERCGNANLVSIIPNLMLKMGFETGVSEHDLRHLTHVSRMLDERLNRAPNRNAAFVGDSAFAHKGGLHVSAVERDPRCYEHIAPETVGNARQILVSNQSGRSNVIARFREIGLEIDPGEPKVNDLLDAVKRRESEGYAYDGAEASFELLARRALEGVPEYFRLNSFRVIDERRWNARGQLITLSEATIKAVVQGRDYMTVAEGNGPINALDAALRKVLLPVYPQLADLRLVDYKVRILTPDDATAAITRVMIESADSKGGRWNTVGVSGNIIDASYNALHDSLTYKLFKGEQASRAA